MQTLLFKLTYAVASSLPRCQQKVAFSGLIESIFIQEGEA